MAFCPRLPRACLSSLPSLQSQHENSDIAFKSPNPWSKSPTLPLAKATPRPQSGAKAKAGKDQEFHISSMMKALAHAGLVLVLAAAGGVDAFVPPAATVAPRQDTARSPLCMSAEPDWMERRRVLAKALQVGAACGCALCISTPRSVSALATLVPPPEEAVQKYDLPRDGFLDEAFACGMATGMGDYEEAASSRKAQIFRKMLASLPRTNAVVAEVGMGSFPNAPYLAKSGAPGSMDIIGIDPNDKMARYAQLNARKARLTGQSRMMPNGPSTPSSLRIVHGVSEALPLADASCDAVVCTLTLCSVVDQSKSLSEIKRVLKPGGTFLFWEHVLSETDAELARKQIALTPNQVKRADGCHLDRRTGENIKAAGFSSVDLGYFELDKVSNQDFGFLNPTVAGLAVK